MVYQLPAPLFLPKGHQIACFYSYRPHPVETEDNCDPKRARPTGEEHGQGDQGIQGIQGWSNCAPDGGL